MSNWKFWKYMPGCTIQDLTAILAGVFAFYFIPAKVGIKSGRECFICSYTHAFGYIFELIVANARWWMKAISNYVATCFLHFSKFL